jgi:hypothetical protein
MTLYRGACCGAAVFALGCAAARPTPDVSAAAPDVAAVRAAELARFTAMISRDFAALDTLLAEELAYTHTSGVRDTKASLLQALRSRRLAYDSIVPAAVQVRLYGEMAVATGDAQVQARADGAVRRLHIRFTEAYVHRAGRWELVAWESTLVPEP